MKHALAIALALGLCVACDKKPETTSTTTTTAPVKPAAPAAAPSAEAKTSPADDGEGLPTEEDFEDEAEQKISAQNADEELDKLEKEIAE